MERGFEMKFKTGDKIKDKDGYEGIVLNVPIGKMKGCLFIKYPHTKLHMLIKDCEKLK